MLGPVAAGVLVAAYVAALRRYGIFDPVDEGLLLVQATRVAAGQVPHADFHTGYGPLYFRLQAALVAAGGLDAVRGALVAVHGAAAALLYVLARRLGGTALAIAAVALEVAFFLPVSPRLGAPFNAPYPGWYAGLAGVAIAVLLGGARGAAPALRCALAGALAGLVFAIKPNSGLLLAAGAAAAIVLAGDARTGPRAVRLAVLALLLVASLVLVVPTGFTVAAFVLVAPVAGLVVAGMERGASDRDALPRLGGLAGGFLLIAAVGYAGTLATLGPGGFMHEVLLIGAGVAALYVLPLPWTAAVAAAVGLAAFVLRGGHARPLLLAAAVSTGLAFFAGAESAGSAASAVRRGAEAAAFALLPLALWGALTVVRRRTDDALVAPTAVAVAAALQAYPRPDFIHVMPLGVLLLPLALRLWRSGVGRVVPMRAAGAVAFALPLVLAAGRFVPTLEVLERLATGRVFEVPLGPTRLQMEPAGVLRLRALAETAEAVRQSPEGEPVLSFPACGMVLFVAARLPAGPHDYFYPGRPNRAEVAALTARLAERPPRIGVTCTAAGTALAAAWPAYPELVRFLDERYSVLFSRPPYTVLERR